MPSYTQIQDGEPVEVTSADELEPAGTGGGGVSTEDVTALITAAVADLLDGAPGALDTLNELAAALGDDASFAATVTAAIAARQPLMAEVFATSDESYTNDDVVGDHPTLLLPCEAHRDYSGETVLFYGGPSAANLKLNFTIPAGASGRVGLTDQGQLANSVALGTEFTLTGPTSTNIRIAVLRWYLATGANAGTIRLQASQGTTNATASIIKAGSSMRFLGGGVANP